MTNLISKIFFAAGLVAYAVFFIGRAQSFALHDYSTDATVIALLGVLAHFAFERPAAATPRAA